jgi:predicted flap endonuclease-1-like 5' DNA nuclease
MSTPTDDQRQLERPVIAAADSPTLLEPEPELEGTRVRVTAEFTGDTEIIYEVQEHDFIVDPDETIELPTGPGRLPRPVVAAAVKPPPPLPPWAAASRALLHDVSRGAPAQGPPGSESQALSDLREAREDLVRFARQMYAREVYVQEVERALAAAQGRVRGQAFRLAELEQALREQTEEKPFAPLANEHEAQTARVEAPVLPPAPRNVARRAVAARKAALVRDDLQRIRGIGPRMEERLNALGIASFERVASWKVKDLERVAKELGVTRERIQRDGWVKQARVLQRSRR